jgi:hypothetical protein
VDKIRPEYLKLISEWNAAPETSTILNMTQDEQKKVVLDFFEKRDHRDQLTALVEFFETVALCVQHRACDRNTTLELFKITVDTLFEISAFYILETRKTDRDPAVGEGLERLYRLKSESFVERYL